MKIRYNLDSKQYQRKLDRDKYPEDDAEIKNLRNRLCSASRIVETDPEDLLEAIERGQTFTPGVMTGTKADTWQSQQIVCVDIDNDTKDKKCIENPLRPEDALKLMDEHFITPYAMYYTFSHRDDHPKYRIVVILNKPITDAKEARSIKDAFFSIFTKANKDAIDTSISDNARLIYGSKPGSVFSKTGKTTPLAIMRLLLKPVTSSPKEQTQTDPVKKSTRMTWNSYIQEDYPRQERRYDDEKILLDALDYIPADDYDTWLKCGMALKSEGYTLGDWEAWSRTSSKYKDGDCQKKWDSFKGDGVKGGTIIHLAQEHGFTFPEKQWTDGLPARTPTPPKKDQTQTPTDQKDTGRDPNPKQADPELTSADLLDSFLTEVQTERFKPISTGIDELDYALSGGLERKTLVTLAAAPGAGKTAIAQYILENMAEKGHDVVYVNLEMDSSQLLSRSISRLSHRASLSNQNTTKHVRKHLPGELFDELYADISAIDVRRGYTWTDAQKKTVMEVADYYRKNIAPHFTYVTTNPENPVHVDNTLSSIMGMLEMITKKTVSTTGQAPIVCIDYLQFIEFDMYPDGQKKPENADAIKQTLKALKTFALKYNTVVLIITANNRASNAEGRASMDSARDTSNIEYSGDVMLSLVYTAVEERWLHKSGQTDKYGNTKYEVIKTEFIEAVIDYSLKYKEEYPLIAKLVSLKVVKGRGIQSRRVARFKYDGRYFYYEPDPGTENPYAPIDKEKSPE